jgi:hypothetical protein
MAGVETAVSQELLPEKARTPLDVQAQMVMEIACGMEDPLVIARRYGMTDVEFGALCQWPEFNRQVDAKRAELKASGHTFRLMAGWMAEDLAKELYRQAKSTEASLPQKHEVFKTFAKLADYEPKQSAGSVAGPGFSISIVFNDAKKAEPAIEVKAKEITE